MKSRKACRCRCRDPVRNNKSSLFSGLSLGSGAADRLPRSARADRVVVTKKAHNPGCARPRQGSPGIQRRRGRQPDCPKTRQVDHKTPEGSTRSTAGTNTVSHRDPSGAGVVFRGEKLGGIYGVQRGRVEPSVCAERRPHFNFSQPRGGEAQEPCEVSFLRNGDLLRTMRTHGKLALWVTQHLTHDE